MKNNILYEDETLICIHQPGDRKEAMIVTFSEMLMRPTADLRNWAGTPIAKLGFSAIGFVAKTPNWFPKTSVLNALIIAKPYLDAQEKRIGYGYSMGGWATLYYATDLRLHASIAFSPQYSINPDEIDDPRYVRFFDPSLNHDMSIKTKNNEGIKIIACDPNEKGDWESALKITNQLKEPPVKLPFTGHGSVHCITKTETLGTIFDAVLSNDRDSAIKTIKKSRRLAHVRPMHVASKAAPRRPNLAFSIYLKYKNHFPQHNRPDFLSRFQRTTLQRACFIEMAELYETQKNSHRYLSVLAIFLNNIGKSKSALSCIERAIKMHDNPAYRHIYNKIKN